MSCVPGVSAAIASCTASLTSAGFIPTSSAFLCCQSKRSGNRRGGGARRHRAAAPLCRKAGEAIWSCASSGAMTSDGEDEGKCASQHELSPCEGCSIVQQRRHAPPVRVLPCLAAVAAIAAAAAPADRVTLEAVLDKRRLVSRSYFVDEFENVVAEEIYIQDSCAGAAGILAGRRPAAALSSRRRRRPKRLRARHRDLRSDFLLVKSPDTEALMPFRDVIEVDGVPVRDREARLAKLFIDRAAEPMEQAEQIRRRRRALQPRQHAQHARQPGAGARRAAAVVSVALPLLARQGRCSARARRGGGRVQGNRHRRR